MADVKALAENLVGLTVKEVQELAEFLKSEYGIEPAAAAVVVSGGGDGPAAAEEKTSFNVILKAAGVPLDSPYIAHAREKGVPVKMSAAMFAELCLYRTGNDTPPFPPPSSEHPPRSGDNHS